MQSVLDTIKAEPLDPMLAEMEQEEAALAGANFGILKTMLKKLEHGTLTGAEKQKLRQAMDATAGMSYQRFNAALAARRTLRKLEALSKQIPELLDARTTAEKAMLLYVEDTKAIQGKMRAELSVDVTGGKIGAGEAGERWSGIDRFPNDRRPEFERLEIVSHRAKAAVEEAAQAPANIEALRKEFGALLD